MHFREQQQARMEYIRSAVGQLQFVGVRCDNYSTQVNNGHNELFNPSKVRCHLLQ